MADLKTNYVDDVLDSDKNQFRKYQMIYNDDGTVSFVDATTYTQNGDSFGAKDINDTNAAVNELNSNLSAIIPDYTKATKIFECVDYNITKIDYIAPSDGYLNYKAFKGGILILYGDSLRFGDFVNSDSFPTAGLVPIKKGTSVKITGNRIDGQESSGVEVWFIPI